MRVARAPVRQKNAFRGGKSETFARVARLPVCDLVRCARGAGFFLRIGEGVAGAYSHNGAALQSMRSPRLLRRRIRKGIRERTTA